MEFAVLGLVLDSSAVIAAERSSRRVAAFIETILTARAALHDLMIAVCAIEQGYGVLTGNLRHFQKIPGLTVVPF